MENTLEINREEYHWTEEPIIGLALRIKGATKDSFGNEINGNIFYEVGSHKEDGKLAILPTNRDQRTEFLNSVGNKVMKKQGKFN